MCSLYNMVVVLQGRTLELTEGVFYRLGTVGGSRICVWGHPLPFPPSCLPFLLLSLPFHSLLSPFPSLRSRAPKRACEASRVWGGAPAENEFRAL